MAVYALIDDRRVSRLVVSTTLDWKDVQVRCLVRVSVVLSIGSSDSDIQLLQGRLCHQISLVRRSLELSMCLVDDSN